MKKQTYPVFITMPLQETSKASALKEVNIPSKVITVEKAVNDYNNFYNTRITHDLSDNTRAIWFDLDMLENHLARIENITKAEGIKITRLAFMLGSDKDDKRTVFIAPMTFDEKFDIHRAFSIDNGQITFINRFPIEEYSDTLNFTGLNDMEQSLILGSNGLLSAGEAITLYNNYFDSKIRPISKTVEADTRYVYYEKGVFNEYLGYLKKQGKNTETKISGLNIVFGAYDDSASEGEYANHLSLFFAPTRIGQDKNIVFTSFHNRDGMLDFSKKTLGMVDKEVLSSLFNRGSGAPPPYTWD